LQITIQDVILQSVIPRIYSEHLQRLLAAFPAVTILGPRQSGKTTFAKKELSAWRYVDCERPSEAVPLEEDPEARIAQLGDHVILDEAQRIPALFPVLRGWIDERRLVKGRLVLLDSASPRLIRNLSETLAGRTAFLELAPFRFAEVISQPLALQRLWLRGCFPDAFLAPDAEMLARWFDAYTRTFLERDLSAMGVRVSTTTMRRLWGMLAHLNGALWNASNVASALGVNYQTVNRYVDILEEAYLIRRLPPYFANIGKRLVRAPKLYFRDTGLLHYFLGIGTEEALHTHPSQGTSWEAFVIDQLVTLFQLASPQVSFFHWRTAGGAEVDLLVQTPSGLIPFEIKLHSAPSRGMVRGLLSCMADLNLAKGYVIFPGASGYSLGNGVTALPAIEALGNTARVSLL